MNRHLLGLEIITTEGMSKDEAFYLVKQLECANLALSRFLEGTISFFDYCDILELCGINIDEYLVIVEKNLVTSGISI